MAARTIRLPVPWWAAILITIGIFVVTTMIRSWWTNHRARAPGEVVSNDGYGVPERRAPRESMPA